jgi:hypothetical protein
VAVDQQPQAQVAGGAPIAGPGLLAQVVEGPELQDGHRPDHLLLSDSQTVAEVAVATIVAVATAIAHAGAFHGRFPQSKSIVAVEV